MDSKYVFWLDNPTVLYKNGNYIKILPEAGMTRIEQLNAVTRFCIYYIIILLLFEKSGAWIYIPLVIIILIVILYNIYINDPDGKKKELLSQRQIYQDDFSSDTEIQNYNRQPAYQIESGQYDSNGQITVGKEYDPYTRVDSNLYYTLDELADHNKATCKRPTANNPFMNPLVSEYNTENPPQACNADDDDIKEEIEDKFNENLFMDIDDLFNIKNSQRQFYTIPVPAIPNDQTEFANWLYKSALTCKEDQEQCLRYEPLQFKKHL